MEVKIYSLKGCIHCEQAKMYLDEKNIKYNEIDITDNKQAQEEMKEISGQDSTPVIVMNGEVMVGFDKEKIDALIK